MFLASFTRAVVIEVVEEYCHLPYRFSYCIQVIEI